MKIESIPEQIKSSRAWLGWRKGPLNKKGKFGKIPYYITGDRRHGEQGSPEDRAKLGTFEEAKNMVDSGKAEGIGLALLADLGLVILDCDNCRNPDNGLITDWAEEITEGTYTEVSPSGRGLRAIYYGDLPDAKNHELGLEIFCRKGFVTITGEKLKDSPSEIAILNDQRAALISKRVGRSGVKPKTQRKVRSTTPVDRVLSALEYLDPDDRDMWLKVGWALGRAFERSEDGWRIYCEWAKKSDKFDKSGNLKHMRTEYFERSAEPRASAITLATLFRAARDAGWKDGPIELEDFYAYLPTHQYIHVPTRALWPGGSLNNSIQPWPEANGKVSDPAMWLDQYRAVEQITWHPSFPELIEGKIAFEGGWLDRPGSKTFNLYRPPSVIPGDARAAKRWREHLHSIYPNESDHLEMWLAHRLQFPGVKINHAVVLGGEQGIGKDTLLEAPKCGVGNWNWKEISPGMMMGRFNGWVKAVVVRVSEVRDMGEVDRFSFYDHSKGYIAAPPDVLMCDEKHLREYPVHNLAGYIFTTNYKTGGLYLPPDDRRHYVAWSDAKRDDFSEEYWRDFWAWLLAEGIGAVVAYLHGVDLQKFDPKAPPQRTEAWWSIVQSNASPEDSELDTLLGKIGNPSVITMQQIVDSARINDETELADMISDRKNRRRVPHILERCGYELVRNPNAENGYWKVWGKQCAIYGRKDQELRTLLGAALELSNSEKPF